MKKNPTETAIFQINATVLGREDIEFWVSGNQIILARKQRNTWGDLIQGMQLHSVEMVYSDDDEIHEAVQNLDADSLKNLQFKLFVERFQNDALAFAPVIADLTPVNKEAAELRKIAKQLAETENSLYA